MKTGAQVTGPGKILRTDCIKIILTDGCTCCRQTVAAANTVNVSIAKLNSLLKRVASKVTMARNWTHNNLSIGRPMLRHHIPQIRVGKYEVSARGKKLRKLKKVEARARKLKVPLITSSEGYETTSHRINQIKSLHLNDYIYQNQN